MDEVANKTRGEVSISLGGTTYVMKPEHERAVRLDDALPRGILGTLIQMSEEGVVKIRTVSLIVHHLVDNSPGVEVLTRNILDAGINQVGVVASIVLTSIASGLHSSGEPVAPSNPGTGSIGASGSE